MAAHGPIPKGGQIHHRNGNRADNRLENLELLDHAAHVRLHHTGRRKDKGKAAMKVLITLLALVLGSSVATAATTLNFDNPTLDGGSVSYDGAGGAFVATNVIFQQVIGVNTPANPGVELFCYPVDCTLNFVTGPNTGTEGPPAYIFAGGGVLTLTGGLNTADDGSGAQISPAGTLLAHSGVFADPSVVLGGGGTSLLFVGAGDELNDVTLTDYYGITGLPLRFGNTELSLNNAIFDPVTHGFTATVSDADFANAAVPEPSTLLLVGSGIIGLGVAVRRKLRH
jgi:hypothetical protein